MLEKIFGKKAIRYNGTFVETATWELAHPFTGRKVNLVGMMHIGDDSYYENISEIVARHTEEGAEVQYEMIKPISSEEVENLSAVERAKLLEVRELTRKASTSIMAQILGLSLQKSSLKYPVSAKNIDYTDLEFYRRLGFDAAKKLFSTDSIEKIEKETLQSLLRFVMSHHEKLSLVSRVLPIGRHQYKIILKERNDLALRAAGRTLVTSDVTLVWGAAHLPGMLHELQSEGYQFRHESWQKVCEL